MPLKQESAAVDSTAVTEDITKLFAAANMPRLADKSLYLGIPCPILDALHKALQKQRSEDEDKRFRSRLRYAGIYKERTEHTFHWDGNTYPLAEPGLIEQILTLDFVRQRKNLIMVGPPGVGKSLLAVIIVCKALRENFTARYKTAHNIVTELKEARVGNSLSGYIKRIQSCDLLILEDITFSTIDMKTAQSFFSVIDGRYDRKSTIISSNGNIKDWAGGFPDKSMCSALLGRIYENALLLNMNGAKDMRLSRAHGILAQPGASGSDNQ